MTLTLSQVGEALYGPRWQSELARRLCINDRTVRRWTADPSLMPIGVWKDLSHLCLERGHGLVELAYRINVHNPLDLESETPNQ